MGDTYNGYTREQLQRAFDMVRNPLDWKAPIYATVCKRDLGVAMAAVNYFTATSATVIETGTPGYCRIAAAGYRDGPAGDH